MLILRWLTQLKLPHRTPSHWLISIAVWAPTVLPPVHMTSWVSWSARWGRWHHDLAADRCLRCLPSVLRKGKVEWLTPASWPAWHTPADRCRLATSAGPPPWPAGSPQKSNLWWAPPALWGQRGRDGRSAGDKSYSLELLFSRNVNSLSHDTPHVDGEESGVPFLLLWGCVDRKELQTAKTASITAPTANWTWW